MFQKNLSVDDYSYLLPDNLIAKYPLAERDQSKLLVYKNGNIAESLYQKIDEHLPEDSLLVFNNTKVIEARILFKKPTGGMIEIFCLEPHELLDISLAMFQKGRVFWRCFVGGASKWKHGQTLEKILDVNGRNVRLVASIADRLTDCFVIELKWEPGDLSFAEILHHAGIIPLPPYLHREAEEIDKETYQTVYAKNDGSVAAPTAGLHFTASIFKKLEQKNIAKTFVTLHVGAGTFKPVKAASIGDHVMHAEYFEVSLLSLKLLAESLDKPVVAVGTTSLRTIESLYWLGVKLNADKNLSSKHLIIEQWFPYDDQVENIPPHVAFANLIEWIQKRNMQSIIASTQILIAPGYKLRIAKGIITNFHQPQSTLLLLIAAIVGDDWKKIYDYAMMNNFRFLSYGDGSLLWPKP